jgi:hypothetical protein
MAAEGTRGSSDDRGLVKITLDSDMGDRGVSAVVNDSQSASKPAQQQQHGVLYESEPSISLSPVIPESKGVFEKRASQPLLVKRNSAEIEEPSGVRSNSKDRQNSILIAEKFEMIKRLKFPGLMKAVALVIFITGNVFLTTNFVIGVTDSEQFNVDGSVRTAIQIACPLYFYYAGREEAFFPSSASVVGRLFKKLCLYVLPSLAGLLVLVIPTAYWTRSWNICGFPTDGDYGTFFKEYFALFECRGFDWLWILVSSFLLFVANIPFFSWVRKRYDECLDHSGYLHQIDSLYIFP